MTMNLHTETKLEQLQMCCKAAKEEVPFCQTMPYWDGMDSWKEEEGPNYYVMENHYVWCDLSSKKTYCIYEQEGGFFGGGTTVCVGGLEAEMEPADESADKICIAGWMWTPEGDTYVMDNTHNLEDGINEAFADLVDWCYEPFWGDDYNADGTEVPPIPPGMCRAYTRDKDGNMQMTFRPMPKLNIEERLLQVGFKRPRRDVEHLENMLGDD